MKANFSSMPILTNKYCIIHIPKEISQLLPSRGFVISKVAILNHSLILPLEPDGFGSHWFDCSKLLSIDLENINIKSIEFELDTDVPWFSPEVPDDLQGALEKMDLLSIWEALTVKAKWEWIRWLRSTQQANTREMRIKATCDKLAKGLKRPCCFDQTRCSVPELSKNGKLMIGRLGL